MNKLNGIKGQIRKVYFQQELSKKKDIERHLQIGRKPKLPANFEQPWTIIFFKKGLIF